MKKGFLAFCLLAICANVYALTNADLDKDLKFYEKTTKAKNLSPNDKMFILIKIKNKFKNENVDLSWVDSEVDRLKRLKEQKVETDVNDTRKTEPPVVEKSSNIQEGSIKDIVVSENKNGIGLQIMVKNAGRIKHFLLKDPKGRYNPKIIIDVENAVDGVEFNKKDFKSEFEEVKRVRIGQFQEKPTPIARIIIETDKERKYDVNRTENSIDIVIDVDRKAAVVEKKKPEVMPEQKSAPKLAAVPAEKSEADHKISVGDIVLVKIKPATDLSKETEVDDNGDISLNLIGKINIAGLDSKAASEKIHAKCSKFIKKPVISLKVIKYAEKKVFVLGQVKTPKELTFTEKTNLYRLILNNGGFSGSADLSNIIVRRSGKTGAISVDLEELLRSGEETDIPLIEPGDIIEVAEKPSCVTIIGEVEKPGRYLLVDDSTIILKILAQADGHTTNANLKKAVLLRQDGNGKIKKIAVNLGSMLKGNSKFNLPLIAGDLIYIPSKK